jgi:hypothetical protein
MNLLDLKSSCVILPPKAASRTAAAQKTSAADKKAKTSLAPSSSGNGHDLTLAEGLRRQRVMDVNDNALNFTGSWPKLNWWADTSSHEALRDGAALLAKQAEI